MGWIRFRIRMDPKLLPGSGSGTMKISKLDPKPNHITNNPDQKWEILFFVN